MAPFTLGGSAVVYASSLTAMIATLKICSDEIDKVHDDISSNNRYYNSQIEKKSDELREARVKINRINERISSIISQIRKMQGELSSKSSELSSINNKIAKCRYIINRLEEEKRFLKANLEKLQADAQNKYNLIRKNSLELQMCKEDSENLKKEI